MYKLQQKLKDKERGAVSLFIVVFAALLITIVTISFIRLMLTNQQQASTDDLSQSAYDSAQAGVEDAKRAILQYENVCTAEGPDSQDCLNDHAIIDSTDCNTGLSLIGITSDSSGQVKVQEGTNQDSTQNAYDQAYTCVIMQLETDNYLGTLAANQSQLIPLTVEPGKTFDTVRVQWYDSDDLSSSSNNFTVSLLPGTTLPLLLQSSWPINRPSILRAQLMQFATVSYPAGDTSCADLKTDQNANATCYSLSDFDNTSSTSTQSDANTLFLYPVSTIGSPTINFTNDGRTVASTGPSPVTCSSDLSSGGYACSVYITIPAPLNVKDPSQPYSRTAYLRLSPLYNATHYSVTLLQSIDLNTPVKFNGVQPEVDSTGRANDLFSRVSNRIELATGFNYPDGAVDVTGNLCKDFVITDLTSDYKNNCTP